MERNECSPSDEMVRLFLLGLHSDAALKRRSFYDDACESRSQTTLLLPSVCASNRCHFSLDCFCWRGMLAWPGHASAERGEIIPALSARGFDSMLTFILTFA